MGNRVGKGNAEISWQKVFRGDVQPWCGTANPAFIGKTVVNGPIASENYYNANMKKRAVWTCFVWKFTTICNKKWTRSFIQVPSLFVDALRFTSSHVPTSYVLRITSNVTTSNVPPSKLTFQRSPGTRRCFACNVLRSTYHVWSVQRS